MYFYFLSRLFPGPFMCLFSLATPGDGRMWANTVVELSCVQHKIHQEKNQQPLFTIMKKNHYHLLLQIVQTIPQHTFLFSRPFLCLSFQAHEELVSINLGLLCLGFPTTCAAVPPFVPSLRLHSCSHSMRKEFFRQPSSPPPGPVLRTPVSAFNQVKKISKIIAPFSALLVTLILRFELSYQSVNTFPTPNHFVAFSNHFPRHLCGEK